MRLTTYKNREFIRGIYFSKPRTKTEWCEGGHYKPVNSPCFVCNYKETDSNSEVVNIVNTEAK